jgi:two-component system, NtrC family, response regulator AtoC
MVVTCVSDNSGEYWPDCAQLGALARSSEVLAHHDAPRGGPRRGVRAIRDRTSVSAVVTESRTSAFVIGDHTVLVADPEMLRLYELIERLACTKLPILILGESGVGKENVAQAVHAWSAHATAPMVRLNCATVQVPQIELELFGYERGAFAGAVHSKPGVFERAHGGTLFLDEVNALPAPVQAKLLRVLEHQRVTRIGGTQARATVLRVVAATSCDLMHAVAAGRFRQDLYFRLDGATVVLPPLRARSREIPILARHFLAAARPRAGGAPIRISTPAMRRLVAHPWPGNIRELKNAMEYAAALVDHDRIEPWHLPAAMAQEPPVAQANLGAALPAVTRARAGAAFARTQANFRPLAEELRDLEQRRIVEALRAAGGVKRRAAELIGMPIRTFTGKLVQYGLRGHSRDLA